MDNIEAKMDKGVLTVTIPVIEEKSKKIKVIEA
jgi:HSP20 family molecular chaperone IbpA